MASTRILKEDITQQWNLTVEQEAAGFDFGGSYVGSDTTNLAYLRNLSQPQPSTVPFSLPISPIQTTSL